MLHRLDEAVALIEALGSPHVKVMADLFHMSIEEDDLPAALRRCGPQLGHVHLADSQRAHPAPGTRTSLRSSPRSRRSASTATWRWSAASAATSRRRWPRWRRSSTASGAPPTIPGRCCGAGLGVARRGVGVRVGRARAIAARRTCGSTARSWCRSRRRRRPAASAGCAWTGRAGTGALRGAGAGGRRAAAAALRRGRPRGDGLGQRCAGGRARGRLHAVRGRHHGRARARGGEQELVVRAVDDPRDLEQPRGKQDWQDEPHDIWYPRTTGIWQTVWLEAVPAPPRRPALAPRRRDAGRRARGARRRAPPRRRLRARGDVRPATGSRRATAAVHGGDVRPGSRCPTRASPPSADGCCGRPSTRRCSTRSSCSRARRRDRPGRRPTRRCARSASSAAAPAQRAPAAAAARARPGLLARDRPHAARRGGARARRRAGPGARLQRRAQASEGRGPALPARRRRARPAGVGGDAERLPLHARARRAAHRASGSRRSSATRATPASSPGCRSTSRGASSRLAARRRPARPRRARSTT